MSPMLDVEAMSFATKLIERIVDFDMLLGEWNFNQGTKLMKIELENYYVAC